MNRTVKNLGSPKSEVSTFIPILVLPDNGTRFSVQFSMTEFKHSHPTCMHNFNSFCHDEKGVMDKKGAKT